MVETLRITVPWQVTVWLFDGQRGTDLLNRVDRGEPVGDEAGDRILARIFAAPRYKTGGSVLDHAESIPEDELDALGEMVGWMVSACYDNRLASNDARAEYVAACRLVQKLTSMGVDCS